MILFAQPQCHFDLWLVIDAVLHEDDYARAFVLPELLPGMAIRATQLHMHQFGVH